MYFDEGAELVLNIFCRDTLLPFFSKFQFFLNFFSEGFVSVWQIGNLSVIGNGFPGGATA
jgi:hypothetical protein